MLSRISAGRLRAIQPLVLVRGFAAVAPLDASKLQVTKTTSPRPRVAKEELKFGQTFSDHMLVCDWTAENGWAAPKIVPYGNFSISPAASVFHYALECFEGMKAYRGVDDRTRLFRPMMNMNRLQKSMSRVMLPDFDRAQFLKCMEELVRLDKSWIPEGHGYSLYLRPTAISTYECVGVAPPKSARLFCITCPVGPYYPRGFHPVSLFATNTVTRAWPGGTGNTKIGGNYAPTILPAAQVSAKGFDQVLWLYSDKQLLTEVGTMNFFVFWVNEKGEKELVTAPLDGTILEGVTRDSILGLARSWNEFKVSERSLSMFEVIKASQEGRLLECFGAGTAAVVSPVRNLHFEGKDYPLPLPQGAGAGPLTNRVWNSIIDIQYGKVPSDWSVPID